MLWQLESWNAGIATESKIVINRIVALTCANLPASIIADEFVVTVCQASAAKNEVYCAGPVVFLVNLEGPNACHIIDGSELETTYFLAVFPFYRSGILHPFEYGGREPAAYSSGNPQ